jgi:hypothetical protein
MSKRSLLVQGFFSTSATLKFKLCDIERKYTNILEIVLRLFVAAGKAELNTKTVSYTTHQKILSKPFTVLAVLLLLWRKNIVQSSMIVLHLRQASSAVLLNSRKKQEVCAINVPRDINVAHLSVQHGRQQVQANVFHV